MGNCIQTQRGTNTALEPKRLSHDNGTETVVINIPIQESSISSQRQISEISVIKPPTSSFPEPSSKEEVFYDSIVSIESDFEDFYSANGDTTPSSDDTTIHISREGETFQAENTISIDNTTDSQRGPSSNKLLIEYLDHESFNSDGNQMSSQKADHEADPSISNLSSNSSNKGSNMSIVNLVRRGKRSQNNTSSNSESISNARRPAKSCLSNLVQSLSFSQKKKAISTA
ncbi:hypothetical protein L484_005464 [Morus notabilis]|uniref:Uncharacterized protein n=1 Tax=Morus notabilis TaxID=981085 RepID=W9SGX6_9ROSA|nr:uncharacterized protein LOC21388930 [Morus notabilis]EXC06143.1 hypothetical protein L484_005464 [Morus notabilis]